jgi:hypothetical protein
MYGESQILHHASHSSSWSFALFCLPHQLLYAAVWVDFHGAEVREAIDETGLLAEFLREGIGQIVCGVGRDEEDRAANFCELYCEGAGGGGLSYATFSADEDPAECFLVEY